MAQAHVLRIDSLPVIDRGNGIQTTPLVTKEIGLQHLTTGITLALAAATFSLPA